VEARQLQGLSQKEVGDKLFLAASMIKLLDEGRYSSIPKKAFIRGYLRNYARIVGVSDEEVIALYEAELQSTEPLPEISSSKEELSAAAITGPVLQTGFLGLLGVALVAMIIWFLAVDEEKDLQVLESINPTGSLKPAGNIEDLNGSVLKEKEQKPTLDQAVSIQHIGQRVEVAAPEMKTEISKLIATEKFRKDDNSSVNLEASKMQRAIGDIEGQPREIFPLDQKPEVQSALSKASMEPQNVEKESRLKPEVFRKLELTTDGKRNVLTLESNGKDRLELSFKDDCWVEISDDQFGLIYTDLNRADDVLVVEGTAPFKVLLGKATGVQMIYNDLPVELDVFVRSDQTAKLSVPTR
jgi:cytoskeleton protein RodZ